jgi:hypothetical protein
MKQNCVCGLPKLHVPDRLNEFTDVILTDGAGVPH